jgi:hypothetical protein
MDGRRYMEIVLGLIGAVLGAGATVLAVLLTSRHEARMAADQAADGVVAQMQSASWAFLYRVARNEPTVEERLTLSDVIMHVYARTNLRYRAFALHILDVGGPILDPEASAESVAKACARLTLIVTFWWTSSGRERRCYDADSAVAEFEEFVEELEEFVESADAGIEPGSVVEIFGDADRR